MPSLSSYRNRLLREGRNSGEQKLYQSNLIMDETWWEDPQSQVGYLYDYDHDDEPFVLNNLHPELSSTKQPIDVKFIVTTNQTMDKDDVQVCIQFRPNQKCNVDYYDQYYGKKYNATFPVGLYIDLKDDEGNYNRWLIVDVADYNVLSFKKYFVIRCDYVFKYIHKGTKYRICGCTRSQNSYIVVRFISEMICQKFPNCRKLLRGKIATT